MNENNRTVLRRYHEDLCKDIIVTEELLGELFQVGVFQKDMIEIIRYQPTPTDKIHKLLDLLPRRGPDALDKFIGVIEGSYPWLATVLTSAQVKTPPKPKSPSKTPSISNSRALSRSLDDQHWNLVDGDIKRIVAAFVHRQFGQSKRVSEKDKKCVERFMADQIQRERTRYQSILASTTTPEPCSRTTSALDNVFQSSEVQEKLFSVHIKLDKAISKNVNIKSDGTTYDQEDGDREVQTHGQQTDTSDHSFAPKLSPDDMDFDMIHKEIDLLTQHVQMQEDLICDSLKFFDSRDHHRTLPILVHNLVVRLEYNDHEMAQDRKQIKRLLDEVQNYTDHIENLEIERQEHRKQIQAAHLDMAALRKEKCALQERVAKLEKERHANQQEDSNRFRLGLYSKAVKTTPRSSHPNQPNSSINGPRNYTTVARGSSVVASVESEDGYAKRNVNRSLQRPGNTYLSYARRNQAGGRFGAASPKKRGVNSFNTTTKF